MSDPNVNQDPTGTSSFENEAIDPAAAAAAQARFDASSADSSDAADEHASGNEGIALVTGALAREVQEQKDKYLRLYAEFENFRRRAVRERQEAELKGMQHLLRGLLETIDDVARFAHVDPATTDAKTVVDGVAMVEKKMLKSLSGHGLEVIDPKGHPFDPALHEAIGQTPSDVTPADHVAHEVQAGYVDTADENRLVRPARVIVSSGPT